MKKKIIGIAILAVAAAAFAFVVFFLESLSGSSDKNPCPEGVAMAKTAFAHDLYETITFTDDGVSPACSAILSGGAVMWVNKSTKSIQVSSDPHPVHFYNSEISDGKFILQLEPGEQKSVTMIKRGTFGFHDHKNPSLVGKITIK